MTEGFEVLVHDVIAAMATAPWPMSTGVPPMVVLTTASGLEVYEPSADSKEAFESLSSTRSWGRLGPASDGTTVERSSSMYSE